MLRADATRERHTKAQATRQRSMECASMLSYFISNKNLLTLQFCSDRTAMHPALHDDVSSLLCGPHTDTVLEQSNQFIPAAVHLPKVDSAYAMMNNLVNCINVSTLRIFGY